MAKEWPEYSVDKTYYKGVGLWRVKVSTTLPCEHTPATTARNADPDKAEKSAYNALKKVVKGHRCTR